MQTLRSECTTCQPYFSSSCPDPSRLNTLNNRIYGRYLRTLHGDVIILIQVLTDFQTNLQSCLCTPPPVVENQFPYISSPYATVTINHAVPVHIYISRYQFLSRDVINRRRNNRCVCEQKMGSLRLVCVSQRVWVYILGHQQRSIVLWRRKAPLTALKGSRRESFRFS